MRHHALNLRLITRQPKPKHLFRPRAVDPGPLRRLIPAQRPHPPRDRVREVPLHDVDRVVPRRAVRAPGADEEALPARDPGIQGEDLDFRDVVDEDGRAGVRVRVSDADYRGQGVPVGALGAHFGDGGRELVGADDEAGHDVDDVEMGFAVRDELLGGVEGVGFGCCVGFEGVGVWGLWGGNAHFVCEDVRALLVAKELDGDKPVKTVSDSTLTKSCHGIMATSDEVITTRLILSTAAADFKIPTVPLTAGWIKSRSYSVV
jgi:hypothetical protein